MKFTFLITNLNGEISGVLLKCLERIKKLAPINSQIIVCDNGSTDNSIELINNFKFEDLKIIQNKKNFGTSHARALATNFIKNEITFILDNDAYLEQIDFDNIVQTYLNKKNLAIIVPLILIDKSRKVDYFGDFLTQTGFLKQKHQPLIDFDDNQKDSFVLAGKGAAFIIRTSFLIEVGGFDPFYHIYVEETDLAWKCWLKGKYNITKKKLVVTHGYGSTTRVISKSTFYKNVFFYGPRNYLTMNYTNLEFLNLIYILPMHFFLWFAFSIYCLLIKFESRRCLYQLWGLLNFLYNIFEINKKRKKIQKERTVNDKKIFKKFLRKCSLIDFYTKAKRRPKLESLRDL